MDRGEFLKILGLTASGTALGGFSTVTKAMNKLDTPAISDDDTDREAKVSKPVTVVLVGAGSRGTTYTDYGLRFQKAMTVVGVSDINEERKKIAADKHKIPEKYQFGDWSEVFKVPKFADAVIISTPDNLHYEPCMKALEMGYQVLLEKPAAQSAQQCYDILNQAKKYNSIVGVCHVLRYAPYFIALKKALDSGIIGEVLSIQHFEPILFHHMAHSYVRGNWHNSKETTPIILAKSCHDLDLIRWMTGKKCEQVSAFGSLTLFKKENAPKGSAERCLDCSVESECAFSAKKIYLKEGRYKYVFDFPADKSKHESFILDKLRTTNYGKCVYRCNNDQCDHYVMNMKFEGGLTAAFSMEGLTSYSGRRTRIMGTKGDIVGDMKKFTATDFLTGKETAWNEDISKLHGYSGHAGGDWGIVKDFLLAVDNKNPDYLSSNIDVSIESHVMGFKAEESRLSGQIVKI